MATKKRRRKSVHQIVKKAVADIKKTLKEDLKELKEELNKPLFPKKTKEIPQKELTEEEIKKQAKKKKAKKIILIVMTVLLVLTIAGIIFIYVKLHDGNRNQYKAKGYESSEIIKKNYIDGFSKTSTTGEFNFYLPKDDVNELLSKSVEKLNDKHIESIYYDVGTENHHYFYFDLKVPLIKTRVVLDTVSVEDPANNCYYLAIQNCTIGKMPAFGYLQKKGYFSQEFIGKIAEYSNLPISYVAEYNSIKYEPLKYMDQFPLGDVAGLVFDFAKQDVSTYSLTQDNLGFKISFKKFRNTNYSSEMDSTPVVDVYQRVKQALDELDSSTLPIDEPYVVARLSDKELTAIINNSFEVTKDDDVESALTTNKASFSINRVSVKFIDDITMKYIYDVSVNGYIININQEVEPFGSIYDFETCFFAAEEIESGGIKFTGGDNGHVREINEILNDTFSNLEAKQPKAFESSPLNDSFFINLEGISDELDDFTLKYATKEIRINSETHILEFLITRIF